MALAKYAFLPWLRQGLARNIVLEETLTEPPTEVRSEVQAEVILQVEGKGLEDTTFTLIPEAEVVQNIRIVGPGEISGMDKRAIVKEEPRPGNTNFEPNYLPYLEFYEEDFPWRYSPANTDGGRLRPWICLVVLEESEFEVVTSPDYLLPAIELQGDDDWQGLFPDRFQTWAWAHVHVNKQLLTNPPADEAAKGAAAAPALFDLVKSNPNCASSRIICPRKLKPNTPYHAFLLPAFEQGRLAGLGMDNATIATVDVQQASWAAYAERPPQDTRRWPFYHTWYFRTGEQLDFEFLVRLIEPRDLSVIAPEIGRRPMDLQNSGYLLHFADEGKQGMTELEGALQLPLAGREDFLDTATNIAKQEYVTQLMSIINLNEEWKEVETPASYSDYKDQLFEHPADQQLDDPIVVPPLYGQWYFFLKKLAFDPATGEPRSNWFNELNLDPRFRVSAGMGTQVIQQEQEKLMDRAWDQVGSVVEAIKRLRLGQLSMEVSEKLFDTYFRTVDTATFLGLTSLMHPRLAWGEGQSVLANLQAGQVATPVLTQAFSKIARFNGPILKRTSFASYLANNEGGATMVADLVNSQENVFVFPDVNTSASLMFEQGQLDTWLVDFDPTGVSLPISEFAGNAWEVLDPSQWGNPIGGLPSFILFSVVPPDAALESTLSAIQEYFKEDNWLERVDGEPLPWLQMQLSISSQLAPIPLLNRRIWQEVNYQVQPPAPAEEEESEVVIFSPLPLQPLPATVLPSKPVEPLTYPVFPDPMYLQLRDLSKELFLPGIEFIPENTFSLLETNRHFIESFMVGLNHEMSRELLWREYPTDQRGSYFQKFWESIDNPLQSGDVPDIKPIHLWQEAGLPLPNENPNLTALGKNRPGSGPQENRLVLVVRGELLKKFPNTLIYLQKGKWIDQDGEIRRTLMDVPIVGQEHPDNPGQSMTLEDVNEYINTNSLIEYPTFQAKVEPDITFLGFNDVTAMDAVGTWVDDADDIIDGGGDIFAEPAGYFIVVRERPGEPRFGLDLPNDDADNSFTDLPEWNDLHWELLQAQEGAYINILELIGDDPIPDNSLASLDEEIASGGTRLTKPVSQDGGPDGILEQEMSWGKNAAHMAGILLQLPFMVAIHASEMISRPNP